jgi:CheY-like chemotaxis protein/tetratricopeptide (TPR) repeat protein
LNKSEIRVFIVDDDPSLSKALAEIVNRLGFQGILCSNPSEAINQLRLQNAQLIIIDCLLPKMSGVELAKAIRSEFGTSIPIILTSGIYKDKAFVKDAVQQSGALGFFPKPFQVNDVTQMIRGALIDKLDDELLPLEKLLTTALSSQEKIHEINGLGQVEAYDIPWLSCLLMNSNQTGILRLSTDQDHSALYFHKGRIVQVEMQNPESFFGALLIEKGFISHEQIEQALSVKGPKKLGEKLVDMNLLSPHVITTINSEQTAIRLSKIITDASYEIKFAQEEVIDTGFGIDTETIAPFLIDWLNSKVPAFWLKQRYLKWLDSPTVKLTTTYDYNRLWNIPPLKDLKLLVADFLTGEKTLSQVLALGAHKEDLIYKVFHLLIITGFLQPKRESKAIDETSQIARLKKVLSDMKNQDYFAILGISRSAKSQDIKKTFYELAKVFHPDKIPKTASQELITLAKNVFAQMTSAYETLSDDSRREKYLKEIELGKAEKALQAEGMIEDAKSALKANQAAKALEKLEAAIKLRPPNSELWIHLAWAKTLDGTTQFKVEDILNKIPPEDRHNAIYYFVKGLYLKMLGDDGAAKKCFQNALALNPKFIEAERFLRTIDQNKKKLKTDIFNADLTAVVGSFFRKK